MPETFITQRFEKHNEQMRGFRMSHTDVTMVNAPRRDEPSLPEGKHLLKVGHTRMERGGSGFFHGTTDWSALVPLLKVARYKLSQN